MKPSLIKISFLHASLTNLISTAPPTSLAEEGTSHEPSQHTAKVSLITQDLQKQMLTPQHHALEMHYDLKTGNGTDGKQR